MYIIPHSKYKAIFNYLAVIITQKNSPYLKLGDISTTIIENYFK